MNRIARIAKDLVGGSTVEYSGWYGEKGLFTLWVKEYSSMPNASLSIPENK